MAKRPVTCEMDGVWEDRYGNEHYWHCEEPGVDEIDGSRYCLRHAREQRMENDA